jgi:hypothetical protein
MLRLLKQIKKYKLKIKNLLKKKINSSKRKKIQKMAI